jgi:hypothetical protein
MRRPRSCVLPIMTAILLGACGVEVHVQSVVLHDATATCDPATRSGRVLGDRADPAIDFHGGSATVAGSDGNTYKGDLHPLFSGSAESIEVSFSGDVTTALGKQQHITGTVRCQTPASTRLPAGGIADFTFGGMRDSTCPVGSIPLGFAAGYKIADTTGDYGNLKPRGAPGSAPSLTVTAAGRALHLLGQVGDVSETIDVTVDSVVAPRNGTGSLSYATSVGGKPCGAVYKASLSVKP